MHSAHFINAQIQAEKQIDFTLKNQSSIVSGISSMTDCFGFFPACWTKAPAFESDMSAKKYMSITGRQKPPQHATLQDLADKGVFVPTGGGRSTHYTINL